MTTGEGNRSEGNSVGAGAPLRKVRLSGQTSSVESTRGAVHAELQTRRARVCRAVADAAGSKRSGDGRHRSDTMSTRKGKSHGVSHIEAQKVSARPAAHIVVG